MPTKVREWTCLFVFFLSISFTKLTYSFYYYYVRKKSVYPTYVPFEKVNQLKKKNLSF